MNMTADVSPRVVPARRSWLSIWTIDGIIAVFGLLLVMRTFRILLEGGSLDRTDGSPLFQLFSGAIYLAAIGSLVIRGIPYSTFRIVLRAWPLVLLVALTLVSTLWSQAPDSTFRRAAALILTASFALFLVVRFDLRALLKLVAISFAIFCIGSVLIALVPGVGITPGGKYAGAWRGLSLQKNSFGRTLALGIAVLAAAVATGQIERSIKIAALGGLAFLLLLLSQSATALVTAFASLGVGTVLYAALGGRFGRIKLRLELGLAFLLIVVPSVFFLVSYYWYDILTALGRDPTLSGRVKLWQWAIGMNETREWLGSGYRAFWIDANTRYFSESFYWDADPDGNRRGSLGPDHSHSGYVDVYLEFGFLGLALFGTLIASSLVKLRSLLMRGGFGAGLILAVVLSFVLIYSSTERAILQQSEDLWLFVMVFYLFMVKETMLRADASDRARRVAPRNAFSADLVPTGQQRWR
jgi:exopolysaccharide production protein ExoQ